MLTILLLVAATISVTQAADCERRYNGKCVSYSSSCPRRSDGSSGSFYGGCDSFFQVCCLTLGGGVVTRPPVTKPPVIDSGNAVGSSQCGISSGGWRIISGSQSAQAQWPWQVSLHFTGQHVCGGTLINKNTIVTAAHCVAIQGGMVSRYWSAVIGEINIQRPKKYYAVSTIYRHSGFREFKGNDIAIMKLSQDVPFNDYQRPACVPAHDPSPGDICYVSGFGQTSTSSVESHGTPSNILLHVDVKVITTSTCARAFAGAAVDYRTICAGGHSSKNACRGDSGGPLVCQKNGVWYLHGVVSFGNFPCGQRGSPGVYTRVTAYRDWIQNRS
ncbi:chymotrypsinogen A-like [Tubulanus polymorphus]|uniref:chymotrypsinogen A-like n=1 Tax=Tubulanus polymorphus TaxID=672921 RepID=UPI003DA3C88C